MFSINLFFNFGHILLELPIIDHWLCGFELWSQSSQWLKIIRILKWTSTVLSIFCFSLLMKVGIFPIWETFLKVHQSGGKANKSMFRNLAHKRPWVVVLDGVQKLGVGGYVTDYVRKKQLMKSGEHIPLHYFYFWKCNSQLHVGKLLGRVFSQSFYHFMTGLFVGHVTSWNKYVAIYALQILLTIAWNEVELILTIQIKLYCIHNYT